MNPDELRRWLSTVDPKTAGSVRAAVRTALDRVDELLFASLPPSALGPGVFWTSAERRRPDVEDVPREDLTLVRVGVWRIAELAADPAVPDVRRFRVWFELPNGYRSDGRDLNAKNLEDLVAAAREALDPAAGHAERRS